MTLILSSLSLAMAILACVALLLYNSTNNRLAALLTEQQPASLLDLPSPTFSQATAPEQDLSSAACSNRGIWSEGLQACACYGCSAGLLCETQLAEAACALDVSSGTPVLFEEYWLAQPGVETRIRASDHLFYPRQHLPRLEAAIRRLHALVGNAVTEGREVVIGLGSMQVINAALHAFSGRRLDGVSAPQAERTTQVYAGVPYYSGYPYAAALLGNGLNFTSQPPPAGAANESVVEVTCAPNNPDASMLPRTLPGAWGLIDHAYYWPHFTPITKAVEYGPKDAAIFTLSKLTGHAGSRVGWALVADPALAERMRRFIELQSLWSYENQLRAALLLEHVLDTKGGILRFAAGQMAERWRMLAAALGRSARFSAQPLAPGNALDLWSGETRDPSPAYLWLRCNDRPRDPDCTVTLATASIIGRAGDMFGAGPEYVRLELLMRWPEFLILVQKLAVLASN